MSDFNFKVKLYLENDTDKFMGIGVLWLLQKVEASRSLRQAAAEMGISYSKAFKMIENLESSLGMKVLDRRKGGSDREGASITEFGRRFIALYDSFQKGCKEILLPQFEVFSKDLDNLVSEFSEK